MSTATARQPLAYYLALAYPLTVAPDPDGGYVIAFPDLPGCMTQVEDLAEVGPTAEEIRTLWIETEYELGRHIPLPSYPEEYSGKFNVRLPRSLHRALVESATREGISLNQYVGTLLARGDAQARIEHWLGRFEYRLDAIQARLQRYPVTGVPAAPRQRQSQHYTSAVAA